ncbi:MAG: HEPN domain-containing protein [Blautia sp.]|nr:HEPN domain-containing protein [Blautia sp.]
MDDRQKELSIYRVEQAEESLKASENCFENGFYKDSINRSYYSAFYAIKAVLALGTIDFKRHKDVIAYFNKEYVATEIFTKELGRRLGTLKQLREKSDYDDFYIASKENAMEQIETAEIVLQSIKEYIERQISREMEA